jgi:hypothetical protein
MYRIGFDRHFPFEENGMEIVEISDLSLVDFLDDRQRALGEISLLSTTRIKREETLCEAASQLMSAFLSTGRTLSACAERMESGAAQRCLNG